MDVAVTGTNTVNRGAHLMLLAIQEELARWPGEPRVAVSYRDHQGERPPGADLYLSHASRKYPLANWVLWHGSRLIPRQILKRRGVMRGNEPDLVLDASGFAYSDQWGPAAARTSADLYTRLAAQGSRVILMPQAFGPFTTPTIQAYMARLIDAASLVFARDEVSLKHLRHVAPDAENIRQAPDFTFGVKALHHPGDKRFRGRACIMPNARMLDHTNAEVASWYLDLLGQCIGWLGKEGHRPFVMLHEAGDRLVWEQLVANLQFEVDVVAEADPRRLKAIVGEASVIIGSRFHGLVSAFSQSKTPIGIGWSHKYDELFQEVGARNLMIPSLSPWSFLQSKIESLLGAKSAGAFDADLPTRIRGRVEYTRAQVDRMWDEIKADTSA